MSFHLDDLPRKPDDGARRRNQVKRLWNTWFGRKRIADEERALRAKADEVLEFLTIEHLADHKAGASVRRAKEIAGTRSHNDGRRTRSCFWTRLAQV